MIEATCAACGTVARIAEADVPTGAKFVTCASCKARVALPQQKAATPAAGVKSMAIPTIKPPPIPSPGKAKSDTVDLADLPAPKRPNPLAGATGPSRPTPSALDGADLPAPKSARPPAPAPGALDLDDLMPSNMKGGGAADLPAPKPRPSPLAGAEIPAAKPKAGPLGDLPASRTATSPLADLPAPKKPDALADLPMPKAKAAESPAKSSLPDGGADLPAPKAKPGLTDLPTPKAKPGLADLPQPRKPAVPASQAQGLSLDDELDLPMPKPGANNDLPAPKGFFDDLPQPAKPRDPGAAIDLPAPKGFFDDLPQPAKGGGGKPGQEVAPKGFFDDLPQPAKGGAAKPGQDVAPKGFFEDLPQRAKGGGGGGGGGGKPTQEVAPKGFFDDLPQPAKGGGKGPGIFDDLPQPTKGAASAGLFDDLPQPSNSSEAIALGGSDLELGNDKPLDLDGGGSPDLDLGLPLGEAGGFQDLDLGEPTAKSGRSQNAIPEEPASPIKIKTPGKGGPAAKPIQIAVPKDSKGGGDFKLDLAEDPHGAMGVPAAASKAAAAKKAATKKQTPEELAELRAAKRRKTRVVLGTVLGLAALGYGGFYVYQRHAKQKARAEEIKSGIDDAHRALTADTPTHWNLARTKAEEVIALDPTNTVALGIAAEASIAGALDTGVNGPKRIADGRKFLQDGLGAGKETTELERAQALAYIANNQADKAIPRLKSLIGGAGSDGWLQVYLGWAELSVGDANEALKAFDQAVAKSKATKISALYGHGRAKLMLADIEGARTAFATILETAKDNVCAQVQLSATLPPSKSAQRDDELKAILARPDVTKKQVDPRCVTQVYDLLGDVARENGRLDIARDSYRKALALTATDVAAQVGIARVEMRDNKLTSAADAVTKALAANANDVRAQIANAELLVLQGKLPDAQKQIETLSARKPPLTPLDQAQLDVVKGKKLVAEGKPDEAVDAYAEGAKLVGDLDLTPTMAAVTLLTDLAKKAADEAKAQAYRDRADQLLSALAARAQEDPQLSTQLGVAYLQAGDPNKAETFLRRAVSLKDDDPEAKLELGKALSALGRTDEAIEQIKGAIKLDPKRSDFQLELAVTYQNAGRAKEAIDAYEKLLALADVPLIVRANAGRFFVAKGLLDNDPELIKKGTAQSEPILKEEPDNAAGLYLKGEGMLLDGKKDDAGPVLTKATDLDPEAQYLDALGRDFEARIPSDTKFIEAARSAYERAAKADPKLVHALMGQGAMLVLKKHPDEALKPLLAAHDLDKNNSLTMYWVGIAYYGLRSFDAAHAKTGAQWLDSALTKGQPELPLDLRADAAHRLGELYDDPKVDQAAKAAASWELSTSLGEQMEKTLNQEPPWLTEGLYYLGDEYAKLNNPAAQARAWRKYMDRKPKDVTHVKVVQAALATSLQRYQ